MCCSSVSLPIPHTQALANVVTGHPPNLPHPPQHPWSHPPKHACLNGVKCWGGACNTAQQQKGKVLPAHRTSEAQALEKQDLQLVLHSHSSLIPIEFSEQAAKRKQEKCSATGNSNNLHNVGHCCNLWDFSEVSKIKFLLCFMLLSTQAV